MIKRTSVLLALVLPTLTWATPTNPSNLRFINTSEHSVTLTWRDNSSDEHNFKVFRDGEFLRLLPENTTTFTDTGLNPKTFYRYEVRATDDRDNFIDAISCTFTQDGRLEFVSKGRFSENSHTSFLIDADNNPNTGRAYGDMQGIEYLVQNDALFVPRPNTNNQWDLVNHWTRHTHTTTGDTFSISLDSIENADTIKYSAVVATGDWSRESMFSHMKELYINRTTRYPIVVIGPSTVHLVNEYDNETHEDGSPCVLEGWGEVMPELLKENSRLYNFARAGASAEFFLTPPSPLGGDYNLLFGPNQDHYWAKAREKMQALRGGFLFIQFGGNDMGFLRSKYPDNKDYNNDNNIDNNDKVLAQNLRNESFKHILKLYIDEARKLNFSPIMITSPNPRFIRDGRVVDTRGVYPSVMKELGREKNVMVLDLHAKTLEEFSHLSQAELDTNFGACHRQDGSVDYTHTEAQGARQMAKWVVELMCQRDDDPMAGDTSQCFQFLGYN